MRVPLMPLALSLAVGGLLYAAYQGNKRLVENPTSRPGVASRAPAMDRERARAPTAAATLPGADAGDEEADLSQLDERCTAIAAVAAASVDALESDVAIDEFVRRPLIAFVSDPALRTELERIARSLYDRPPVSASIARRDALGEAGCR